MELGSCNVHFELWVFSDKVAHAVHKPNHSPFNAVLCIVCQNDANGVIVKNANTWFHKVWDKQCQRQWFHWPQMVAQKVSRLVGKQV